MKREAENERKDEDDPRSRWTEAEREEAEAIENDTVQFHVDTLSFERTLQEFAFDKALLTAHTSLVTLSARAESLFKNETAAETGDMASKLQEMLVRLLEEHERESAARHYQDLHDEQRN